MSAPKAMDFDELCEAIWDYLVHRGSDTGARWDDWRERVDELLASIRVELSQREPEPWSLRVGVGIPIQEVPPRSSSLGEAL